MRAPWTPYRNLDAGTTGAVVHAGPTSLGGWQITNASASLRYLKLYDKATAPTAADTPVMTLALPAGKSTDCAPGAAGEVQGGGINFAAGLSIRASTGVADNNTDNTTTNDVVVNLFYR